MPERDLRAHVGMLLQIGRDVNGQRLDLFGRVLSFAPVVLSQVRPAGLQGLSGCAVAQDGTPQVIQVVAADLGGQHEHVYPWGQTFIVRFC